MDNITSFDFAIYEKFEKRDIKKGPPGSKSCCRYQQ